MEEKIDLLIRNASELLTLKGENKARTQWEMNELGIIKGGSVAVCDGKIHAVATDEEIEWIVEVSTDTKVIDAKGKTVMPGFVDPHTHLIFSGSREDELHMKLEGKSYLEILSIGGGILRTVRDTRFAGEDKLFETAQKVLDRMLNFGTTTVEAKSGYGLETETEIRSLEVIKRLNEEHTMDLVATFLGAHAIPHEYEGNPDGYVNLVVGDMIPKVGEKKLAEFCDVFCEQDVFSVEQSKRVLLAGKEYGMTPKIHADEIVRLGGTELACEVGAISASHLMESSEIGIMEMALKGVIGVLVPGTPFALMQKEYPRARYMIDSGVPVALATDFNPNCWTESMQFMIALACYNMGMLPSEAIVASTINAAHAINRADEVGSIEVGKKADIIILDAPNHLHIPYRFGGNLVETVVKGGEVVVERAESSER
ncbi:MAG: imidazolonepropionase [Methanomassiliicoccales archaeon]|nr:MAG: imidazolonepropionase [Methanomassiliicoccales archaeon]